MHWLFERREPSPRSGEWLVAVGVLGLVAVLGARVYGQHSTGKSARAG